MNRKAVAFLSASILLLTLAGCGGGSLAQTTPTPTQTQPPPSLVSITSISPTSAPAGSPDLILTINGSGFQERIPYFSQAIWNTNGADTPLTTNLVSDTEITATVPATLLASPLTAQIQVQNQDMDGNPFGGTSKFISFTVTAPVSSISPPAATLGLKSSQQFTASINGSNSVTWGVEEGQSGGSVSDTGIYSPTNLGTFHVVARSVTSPSETITATVSVVGAGFAETGNMHSARSGHTATLLKNGQVLIVGGGDGSAELFDPARGTFSLTGKPVINRTGASVTLLADGRVLVAGGLGPTAPAPGSPLPKLNTAEIFDPITGLFTPTGSMIEGRWRHTATLLNSGKVLIAGGYGNNCTTASAELFDPATGTFSSAGFMLSERVDHTATLLTSGEVLMGGGSNGCPPDSSDDPPWDPLLAELYAPTFGSFNAESIMATTRIGHVAIRLLDGKVLMLGGVPTVQNLHEQPIDPPYAELYDPVGHQFLPFPGLVIPKGSYAAALLNSGMVLIAGGKDPEGNAMATAELLDSNLGVLTVTGSLVEPRVGPTATLLLDGRVLVTGGTDSKGNALATAEVYQ